MSRAARIRHDAYADFDPYATFMQIAPGALHLPELADAYANAIAAEAGLCHACCVVEPSGMLTPLFGDAPELGHGIAWTGEGLSAEPCDVPAGVEQVDVIPVEAETGELLLMLIGSSRPAERLEQSRRHALTVVYVERGVMLLEAADEERADELTETERQCLGLTLAGCSHLDIGERFGRSAPAIGILIRRAAEKLGAATTAEAVAIASRRGLM